MKKTVETERKIVDAAYRVIKAVGFDAASIKQICKEAGISYSTFYYYFPTKESVVPRFYAQANLFAREDFTRVLCLNGAWERLWAAHCIYLDRIYAMGPEICAQLNRSLLSSADWVAGMDLQDHQKVLEPLIAQAQRSGEILHTGSAVDVYHCSVYLVWGIYFHWSMHARDFNLHRELRRSLETLYQLREDLRDTSH